MKVLNTENSILNDYLESLRNIEKQGDRARFRRNVERIGQILAYEISKELNYTSLQIQTPLAQHESKKLATQPVLATILRAGLALHQGFLQVFDEADNAYISAYRKHTQGHEFEVVVEYMAAPDINGKTLILIDPMLATGQSMVLSYRALLKKGTPAQVIVAGLIAAQEGIDYVSKEMPEAKIYVAALDQHLNEHKYIVPGLGDAGDLCYGVKNDD
ncbi:MAG: uracil phosphoribosyltransferase [Bacteroidia bacterium]